MRNRSWAPWLLALVCFGPVAAAAFIYYGPLGPAWLPQLPGSRELLDPSVPLPQSFRGGAEPPHAWQLIYAKMTPCEQPCAQQLNRLRQVRLALGRDASRVRRVLWHVGSFPVDDPELTALSLDSDVGRRLVAALRAERIAEGRVYVADPRGDLILSYPPDVEQKELLRDLERLLTGSD